ncbi:hypothetical protein PIB30_091351 [Stylosanthes scabra]|uniref:Uncharacterized protein n=1 Tax=Stylosanthes scabra TaxID=79078 RepID=A0ABU6QV08_9FABA|nr:hypothetical protein [Stylosanthes scabra]
MARRTSRESIELGVQKCEAQGAMEMRGFPKYVLNSRKWFEIGRNWPREQKTGRIDSCDDLLLKKFSKCFESIQSVVESIHREVRESIRGLPESIHLCLNLVLTLKTALESILPLRNRFLSGGLRADDATYGNSGLPAGNERVVLGEVRTVVVRDMYWTGRVAKITDQSLRLVESPAAYVPENRESQGLECKLGFYVFRVGPKLRGFRCVELSVCNVTISVERVRGAVSHIGVKNGERKLEEQEGRKLEHSARAPTPRRGESRLGVQSSSPGLSHPRLGVDINA